MAKDKAKVKVKAMAKAGLSVVSLSAHKLF